MRPKAYLSKREQEIMDLVYEMGQITTIEAMERLKGSPSNSTVRTLLRILEEKGNLNHQEVDGRYVYRPVTPRVTAAREALTSVVRTFFQGSVSDVVAALLTDSDTNISDAEIERLQGLIDSVRDGER
ncbi:MAG: BlaI/MecI/CopY family transcriptional regulator [Fimbriimonas sp.]|nr:BlaI/MecI/CopY family transcriptional regulator [Fimbriimonas sp.]